jgi:hypothetical protein
LAVGLNWLWQPKPSEYPLQMGALVTAYSNGYKVLRGTYKGDEQGIGYVHVLHMYTDTDVALSIADAAHIRKGDDVEWKMERLYVVAPAGECRAHH